MYDTWFKIIRAVSLNGFSFNPPPGDLRRPWDRLADYVSEHTGRRVAVEEIGAFPRVWCQMSSALRIYALLVGLSPGDARALPTGQLLRRGGPADLVYVLEPSDAS